MDRTYLFVPPEEKAEVPAPGAQWDTASNRWFIGPEDARVRFSRWLPDGNDDEELTITSSSAYVAAAKVLCQKCRGEIEVICVHCETGVVLEEPLTRFTVSGIWAMDEELTRQLRPWASFRMTEAGEYANYCSRCGAVQDELLLHSEPEAPFFDIPHSGTGVITLTPLVGTVRLGGDEHFTVE